MDTGGVRDSRVDSPILHRRLPGVYEMVKRALALYKRWRKGRRNKREMRSLGEGKSIRVKPVDPREQERRRVMRGNGPGQGWRNY